MKTILREFGGAIVAAFVAGLLMFLICNVPVAGARGLSTAMKAAMAGQEYVLKDGSAVFDRYWRGR